jgi:hypothetical protein
MDCGISLTAKTPANPTLIFDAVTTTESVGDQSVFFENADGLNCPITSCSILAVGCGTAYPPGELSISGSFPFTVTSNKNVLVGWTETVCIECSNALQTITFDNYVVTQNRDCGTALTLVSMPADPVLAYDAVSTASIGQWDSFFANSDATNCAITSCSMVFSLACGGTFGATLTTDVSIAAINPFALTADQNLALGYVATFCMSCSNSL